MNSAFPYRLLDVGGTFIKLPDSLPVPIKSSGSREEIASALKSAIGPTDGLKGIGIAIPGPFDYREGVFRMEHKFASAYGENLASMAGVPADVPVKYMHDVAAVLEGAIRMMSLHGNTALATIGTGLGFCIALHGEVQYGPDLSPMHEIWNRPWNGGILEDFVSSRGIRNSYTEKTGDTTQSAYEIAMRAYAGEEAALEVYSEAGTTLGEAIVEMLEDMEVDTLLMAGQISKSLNLIERPLCNALEGVKILRSPEGAVFEGLKTLFSL